MENIVGGDFFCEVVGIQGGVNFDHSNLFQS